MCRARRGGWRLVTAGLAALALCAPAAAQQGFGADGFGGGSFGGGAPASGGSFGGQTAQPPVDPGTTAPPPSSTGTGGFGGSFGGPAAVPAAGGGGFGGSFGGQQPAAQAPAQTPPPTPPVQAGPPPAPPPPPPTQAGQLDPQIQAFETRDFGVPPTRTLRPGQFHAPTPLEIPGGYLLTTQALSDAMNQQINMVLLDVLGGQYTLPGAFNAQGLSDPGSFDDRTQQQAAQWLRQITGGDSQVPIIVFCSDPMCWLSYNAGLRVVAAGYQNVYWYRGGIKAWQMAGLPLRPQGL